MKKKLLLLMYVFFLSSAVFSASMDDYKTFLSGKSYYEGKEYNKAEQEFLNLLENYPDSKVLSSHYAYYYIGIV